MIPTQKAREITYKNQNGKDFAELFDCRNVERNFVRRYLLFGCLKGIHYLYTIFKGSSNESQRGFELHF